MKCLVDSSAWIRHFQKGEATLVELLEAQFAYTHPMVIGELALGNISSKVLSDIKLLPTIETAEADSVLDFIIDKKICSKGLCYVDAHLLYCALANNLNLLTFDKKLEREFNRLS